MKKPAIAAVLAAAAIAVTIPFTFAQTAPKPAGAPSAASSYGSGMGPGMMGGYGPGMMGGQGPGVMGGHGTGMMGGHGTGMMGGHGTGMMGGYGPGMMGMGMYYALDLTDQQRAKISQIQEEVRRKNWDAMGKLMDESARLRELYAAQKRDPAAIGRQTVKIAEQRRPIIESMVEAHDRIDALLTNEQKERLRSYGRGGMMGGE